jgi:hypothetical protein
VPLLLGPPGGEGDLEVLQRLRGLLPGLLDDVLGGRPPRLDLLVRGGEDLVGLLLGHGEDLLDPGPEVPERGAVHHAHLLAHLGEVALQHLDLAGQLVDLRVRLLPLGRQGGDLVLRTSDVPVDLSFLVPPQSGLEAGLRGHVPAESKQFLAVRHAPILTRNRLCWGDTDAPVGSYFTDRTERAGKA